MVSAVCSRRFLLPFTTLGALFLIYSSLRYLPSAPKQSFSLLSLPTTSRRDLLDEISNSTLGVRRSLLAHASVANRLQFQKIFIINLPARTDLKDAASLAASLTGLDIEFVDGVDGDTISNKSLPNGAEKIGLQHGGLGNWRAHMNVAQIIVEQNIQSALVLESDADWDIRIKQQMRQFAQGSRLLLQPLKGADSTYLDPTNPTPGNSDEPLSFDITDAELQHRIAQPLVSPYGDLSRWDMLWLGHCGTRFPWASDGNAPLGRAMIFNDPTVPQKHHIDVELGDSQLIDSYPDHTRAVSRARVNSCTLGHAFSQQGARKFLYELGIREMDGTTDMMFRSMCDGAPGRVPATCLTVQPQLFQHHRPKGLKSKESDIDDHGDDYNPHAYSSNIRWGTRVNLRRLVSGRTDYIDLYQDGVHGVTWPEDE